MVALASLIAIVLISLLVTRVATVAFTATGLSREAARFQARSALSGVGFTTEEAESVVNHPVRRRIVMLLMLLGSAGIVTVLGTLVLSFANADAEQRTVRIAILLGALLALWLVSRSATVDRWLNAAIAKALTRWTDIDARDYAALLHLSENFAVMELAVGEGEWLTGGTLRELDLRSEGVLILGVTHADGDYVAVPRFDTRIEAGDTVIAYGQVERLCELDRRPAGPEGDRRHEEIVADQQTTPQRSGR